MNTVRKYVYAALLAAAAMNFAPTNAAAEEPAHGKFTLKHDVNWGNAVVPAGEYSFSAASVVSLAIFAVKLLPANRVGDDAELISNRERID